MSAADRSIPSFDPRSHMLRHSFHDGDNYSIAELLISLSVRNRDYHPGLAGLLESHQSSAFSWRKTTWIPALSAINQNF
jgi:hypothetical protein